MNREAVALGTPVHTIFSGRMGARRRAADRRRARCAALADPPTLELRKRDGEPGAAATRATRSCSSTRSSGRTAADVRRRPPRDDRRPVRLRASRRCSPGCWSRSRSGSPGRSARSTYPTSAACTPSRRRSSAASRSSSPCSSPASSSCPGPSRRGRCSPGPLVIAVVGVIDDIFELAGAAEARRARSSPRRSRCSTASTSSAFTLPFVGGVDPRSVDLFDLPLLGNVDLGHVLDDRRHRRRDQRDQPHRRRRRPRRGGLRDLGGDAGGDRALARPHQRRRPGRAHGGRRARLPAPRLPAGVELHGRHRLEPARLPARRRSRSRAR